MFIKVPTYYIFLECCVLVNENILNLYKNKRIYCEKVFENQNLNSPQPCCHFSLCLGASNSFRSPFVQLNG